MDFQRMLDYCAGLKAHNERAWFHENHRWYESARADYIELLEISRFAIAEKAPELASDIMYMNVKDWMYRIARDMRYYKDSPPYVPAFRAYISADRKSWMPIGYFLRIAPGESCFGTGLWCGTTAKTNRVRDYISAHLGEFEEAREVSGLPVEGESLKTVPRGYSASDPAAEWIRLKNWTVIKNLPDSALTDFESFAEELGRLTERMEPLRRLWLEAARSSERGQKHELEDFYSR